MLTMRLTRDVHCGLSEALRAMHIFALLYGEARLAALDGPGIEFICEPLFDERARVAAQTREVFFARRACSPPFELSALYGVASANPNGLTTTIAFDVIYEPDAGIIGAIFDRFMGRRLAKEGATAFFQRLLRFIEQEAGLDSLLDRLLKGERPTGRA